MIERYKDGFCDRLEHLVPREHSNGIRMVIRIDSIKSHYCFELELFHMEQFGTASALASEKSGPAATQLVLAQDADDSTLNLDIRRRDYDWLHFAVGWLQSNFPA